MSETQYNTNIPNILSFIYLFNSQYKNSNGLFSESSSFKLHQTEGEKEGVKHNKVTQINLNSM